MPTENERKYVLRLNTELDKIKIKPLHVRQGYLMTSRGMTLRFRHVKRYSGENVYIMSFKCNTGKRTVEIENKRVSKRDFDDVWPFCMNKVYKVRNLTPEGWEIDFFLDHRSEVYLVMAEYEMPEGQEAPKEIPDYISENLIYEVPLTDFRFSSKLLSDVRYSKEIYNLLKNGEYDEIPAC